MMSGDKFERNRRKVLKTIGMTGMSTASIGLVTGTGSANDELSSLVDTALNDPEVKALINQLDAINNVVESEATVEGETSSGNQIIRLPYTSSTRGRQRGKRRRGKASTQVSGYIMWMDGNTQGTIAVDKEEEGAVHISESTGQNVSTQSASDAAVISAIGPSAENSGISSTTDSSVSVQSPSIDSLSEFLDKIRSIGVGELITPAMPCNFGEEDYIADLTCISNLIQANEDRVKASTAFSVAVSTKNPYAIIMAAFWALYELMTNGDMNIVCNPCTTSIDDSLSGVPISSSDIPSDLPGDMEDYI